MRTRLSHIDPSSHIPSVEGARHPMSQDTGRSHLHHNEKGPHAPTHSQEDPMTETPEPVAQVAASSSERLGQLHAAYADAKAAADESATRLKAITDAIKVELNAAAPEARRIQLTGPDGPALRLAYAESWRVDSKKLKATDPETYARYAVRRGSWTLRAAQVGEE